ncbi:hypothetical protein ACFC00_24040 [Streptomyces adustus]|uniref:hypothetical protein n=1 Tax=Streptomyces adustus TaxID=1609272 RepID=UPI0035D7C438
MPAVKAGSRALIVTTLVGSIIAGASPAMADTKIGGGAQTPPSGSQTSGNVNGDTVSATAGGVVFDTSKNGSGASVGPVASADTSWTPPACWYAPKYTPQQLQDTLEPIWEAGSTGDAWDADQRAYYVDGDYKDFNKAKTGKGYWWDSYVNESFPPGWDKCTHRPFWVDNGDAPPADIPNVVTPEILAGLAYAQIRVPTKPVTLKPEGTTKVNLPTWAWLDGADFKPVSVTARVPSINGLFATTTAEPVSLKIEPGTADAETYPASGVCEIRGGHIGEEYAAGKANETPPCGVRYLRSSGDGTFHLRATVTWKIHWVGSGNTGDTLPDGTFGADQDVVVQEIQAVNR